MRRTFGAVAAACLALAGCGGGHTTAARGARAPAAVHAPAQCNPSAGQGYLGACTTQPANPLLRATHNGVSVPLVATGSQGYIHDIYEGNYGGPGVCGAPLSRARGLLVGVIVKVYEFREDGCFVRYWHELQALHIWHSAYIFARAGCSQAGPAAADIKAAGGLDAFAGPPVIDEETPDGFGQFTCLAPQLKRLLGVNTIFGYTAPGTYPGGGTGGTLLWIATYGSSIFPGCSFWTCHPIAWQYTDGQFGPGPHSIGPFSGDFSVSYGMTQILAHPGPPPDLYAKYPKVTYQLRFGQRASEHGTVSTWDLAGCENPVVRSNCKSTRWHLQLLRDRAVFVAHNQLVHGHWVPLRRPRYAFNQLGARIRGMERRLTAKPGHRCTAATCG